MVLKYNNFIIEGKYSEIESEYHSIGEWIEKISDKNEYLLGIISNYIKDVDTNIRISNAVNLLDDFDKKQLFYRVYNYLKNKKEKTKEVSTDAHVVIESNQSLPTDVKSGKHTFVSFLKSLTALGLSSISKYDKNKPGFLFYYLSNDIDTNKLKLIFNRFKTLNLFSNRIDYTFNTCKLYFGIKNNSTFEYGIYTDKEIIIGEFTLNKSNLTWLLLLQSPSANSLKKDIINIDASKISLYGKIDSEIKNFNINSESKIGPIIKDDIITYGYYGVGKWDNGKLDNDELVNLKFNFKNWLAKYNWSNKVLINISYKSFWIYFNIKLK